jgi:hypothetical protein
MPSPSTSRQTTADYATDPTIGVTKFPTATVASQTPIGPADPGFNLPPIDTTSLPGTTAVPTFNTTSIFDTIGSGLTSLLPGGSNAPTGMAIAGTGLGLAAASQAQKDLAALSGQEQALGQPYVDAGKADLAKYQSGTISPAEQAAADYMKSAGATNISEAAPLLQLGNTYLGYAATNSLPPNVEAKLSQDVAAQKAAATQQYGADSSALTAVLAQIDGQAAQTRQNLINTYGTQGQSYYASGTALQQTGQADTAAGYQAIVNDIQQNLTNAMAEASLGFGPIEAGIQAQIEGDATIADALMGMFGELYKNVAASTAPATGGGGGSSAAKPAATGGTPAASGGGSAYGATPATNTALTNTANLLKNPLPIAPNIIPSNTDPYTAGTNLYNSLINQTSGPGLTTDTALDPKNYVPGTSINPSDFAGNIPGTSFNPNAVNPWDVALNTIDPVPFPDFAPNIPTYDATNPLPGIAPVFSTADTYTPTDYSSYVTYG